MNGFKRNCTYGFIQGRFIKIFSQLNDAWARFYRLSPAFSIEDVKDGDKMNKTVLIADDEKEIVDILRLYLEKEGLHVLAAYDGAQAYSLIANQRIDIAIFDIMMPNLNGFELIKIVRENLNIPILVLSAKAMDSDKILGLDLGADDYVTKPFNPLEIVARVKSHLRRAYELSRSQNSIKVGSLVLDDKSFKLYKGDEEIMLTATEFKLLKFLMESPGRVYTKVQIWEHVKGEYFYTDDNSIMVHISNLREKIEDNPKSPRYIKTIRGLGYKFEKLI